MKNYVFLRTSQIGHNMINQNRYTFVNSGHTALVRTFVHSPTMPAFITGSEDFRARFWYKKPTPNTGL